MKQKDSFQSKQSADTQHLAPMTNLNRSKINVQPSREEVAKRAYAMYLNQGCLQGHDLEHWLLAEAEIIDA